MKLKDAKQDIIQCLHMIEALYGYMQMLTPEDDDKERQDIHREAKAELSALRARFSYFHDNINDLYPFRLYSDLRVLRSDIDKIMKAREEA